VQGRQRDGTEALVLLSGGIDSSALLPLAKGRGLTVRALHVSYGQAAEAAELAAAVAIADSFGVPLTPVVYQGKRFGAGEIRGRNALLLTIALLEFGPPSGLILIGIHGGTEYIDCGSDFLGSMQALYTLHTSGAIMVEAPFARLLKGDVVRLAHDLKVPIERTHSCEASNLECGRCQSCVDRVRLMKELAAAHA
jgi:7-cyano-7-deazaguanine synthase